MRADASESVGSGHVMRISAIAEELITRGEDVIFVGQIVGLPWVKDWITSLGFRELFFEPRDFISDPLNDSLILDSYEISVDDAFLTEDKWLKIVAIVDESTPNYRCSFRIHPGLDSSWVGNSTTPVFSGPRFIPFRSSLSKYPAERNPDSCSLKIVVVAGGSDPYGVVPKIANILGGFSDTFNAHLFTNASIDFNLDSRFQCHKIGLHLDELTKNADLVLTTASTSSLEFLARGFCVGVICAIQNQRQYYDSLGQLDLAAKLGVRDAKDHWQFDHEQIQLIVSSKVFRERFKNKGKDLLDFEGSRRIVDLILSA